MTLRFGWISSILSACLMAVLISCGDTKHPPGQHKFTNELIGETSPYLLQHAHNPVDWKPWSQDALSLAEEEDKLVIVSIGYSSCHWCHVMEEETFEDEEVATLMNQNFVSIKVDREERPDVDQVYMTAAQLLTGSGGWPLNIIALPNGKPIYAGTYHTREEWMKVLADISQLFRESPAKAYEYADKVAQGIQAVNLVELPSESPEINTEALRRSLAPWKEQWDLEWGGNKGLQKFMLPDNLIFLLDYALLEQDQEALAHVRTTLNQMARGGIYDQIGGGFYRYSTDPHWRVPHFEKMLYDNAQLIKLYSIAYTVYKDPAYKAVVEEITAFLDREMRHAEGAYFAAMDADSEGGEGAYYVWTPTGLKEVLAEEFDLFSEYYNVREGEAWEEGRYILHRPVSDSTFLENHNLGREEFEGRKDLWKKILLEKRQQRQAPRIDDKIITSWNALLIDGFVAAFEAFHEKGYLDRARQIRSFLYTNNRPDGNLQHSFKKGGKPMQGFLEDYAFLARAELQLYAATGDEDYLETASELLQQVEGLFFDEASGLYRFKEDDELIARIIKTDDGVIPSPNAVMAHNLFIMGHIYYKPEAISRSREMLSAVVPILEQNADLYSHWAKLFLQLAFPYYEVAVVGEEAAKIRKEFRDRHVPNILLLASAQPSNMPLFKSRFVEGETFIYVCQNHSCKLPVNAVADALEQMGY